MRMDSLERREKWKKRRGRESGWESRGSLSYKKRDIQRRQERDKEESWGKREEIE